MSDYEIQADKFLKDTDTIFEAAFLYSGPYFDDDKETRDVYQITLKRRDRTPWVFRFGQSINKSKNSAQKRLKELDDRGYSAWSPEVRKARQQVEAPTAYDVLACIEKNDPGTFAEFCSGYGYSEDSRKAERVYFAVQEEWKNCKRVFGDVLEKLQEIA